MTTLTAPAVRPTDPARDAVLLLIAGDPMHARDRAAIVTAIRASVREDGTTTANDWRPLVPSWVDKRCVGAVVYALTQADVMVPTGEYDWCDDTSSRNRGKPQPRWTWVEPEAAA